MTGLNHFIGGGISFLFNKSLFLFIGSAIALIWANLELGSYEEVVYGASHLVPGLALASPEAAVQLLEPSDASLLAGLPPETVSLHFLVNDILMCFFFALAAKEIWEALLPGGALSSAKKAATPLLATLGGVLGPAALYWGGTLFFERPDLANGWAIPCATDIAFSYLVTRAIFGEHHPAIPFLLLIAIADDAIGLAILAIFYPTGDANLVLLLLCMGSALGVNLLLRRLGVKNFWSYLAVAGPLAWYGCFKGGVHPALALVPLIPTFPHASEDKGLFREGALPATRRPRDTLNEFAHWWKKPVELILMAFGFANAGVLLGNVGLPTGLVAGGLLLGKPLGITLFTLGAVKLFGFEMPLGMQSRDVVVLSIAASIGFTVALFISGVAFAPPAPAALLDAAKMGGLLSFAAAGFALLAAKFLGIKRSAGSLTDA